MQEWKTPFKISFESESGYLVCARIGVINYAPNKNEIFFWNLLNRKICTFDLKSKSFINNIDVKFDIEELLKHANGFTSLSEWEPYGCYEGALQTLKKLIEGTLPGKKFDRDKQLNSYKKFNASMDGDSGEKIYRFVKQKLEEKRKS